MSGQERLPFVSLDLAGTVGLEPGRYLERGGTETATGGAADRVLVVTVAGAPPPPRHRFRRPKPAQAAAGGAPPTVPLTTLAVIRPEPLGDEDAARDWLAAVRDDAERAAAELSSATSTINRAIHAHRTAVVDPNLADVSPEHALVARIGFGIGDELADGLFTEAIEIPRAARRRRGEALQPQERLAAVLGGREQVPACELVLLRARSDLDAGRAREAALQLRIGLEALLAERQRFGARGQEEDLAALGERRGVTGDAANEALRGEPAAERISEVRETLELAERVLRRQRALG